MRRVPRFHRHRASRRRNQQQCRRTVSGPLPKGKEAQDTQRDADEPKGDDEMNDDRVQFRERRHCGAEQSVRFDRDGEAYVEQYVR